jgi:hypothetical protein
MKGRVLALFRSTHQVIKGEVACVEAKISYRIVPIPKSISPECGMAIEIAEKDRPALEGVLRECALDVRFHEDK